MEKFQGDPITWSELKKLLEDKQLPSDVRVYSDSRWECGPTGVFGIYYNPFLQVLVLTQEDVPDYEEKGWVQFL